MTLDEIVTFCRKNGVLVWRGEAEIVYQHPEPQVRWSPVELHFGPPPPTEEGVKDVDKTLKREERRGKDGLTAREQIELHGQVIDKELLEGE